MKFCSQNTAFEPDKFSELQKVCIPYFKEFNFCTLVENSKNTSKQLHFFSDLEYFTSIRYTDMDKKRQKKREE